MKWRALAACQGMTELFFLDEGAGMREVEAATQFCKVCPVRLDCLDFALKNHEKHGIWGGLTPNERRRVLKKRNKRRTA